MKFSASFSALCALAVSIGAAATPLNRRTSGSLLPRTAFSTGAAYFMTNQPTGNTIVAADIGVDGTLTLSNWYTTGGFGQHGADALPGGPDPLFSQGALQVHHASNLLAVVNPGSDSISLFSIDPTSPSSLTQLGFPVPSGGEFPISVAFNEAGNLLCALNGGFANGVQCFNVNNSTGLTPIQGSWRPLGINVTTPPAGPFGSASQVTFSPDQQNVVAITKGTPTATPPGFVASWSLNGTALSPTYTRIELPAGAGVPFSIGAIPGQNAFLATDALVGTVLLDLTQGISAAFSAPATANLAVPGQKAICWQAWSNATGNFYVSDIMTNLITEINVSSNLTQSVVTQYPTLSHAAALDLEIATIGGKDYLYTLLPNVTSVHVMSLEGPGEASTVQILDIAQTLSAAGVPFNGGNLQGMTTWYQS